MLDEQLATAGQPCHLAEVLGLAAGLGMQPQVERTGSSLASCGCPNLSGCRGLFQMPF